MACLLTDGSNELKRCRIMSPLPEGCEDLVQEEKKNETTKKMREREKKKKKKM